MNEDNIYRAKVIRYLAIAAEHGYLNYLRKLRASARTVHLDSLPENFQRTGWEEDPLTQVARRRNWRKPTPNCLRPTGKCLRYWWCTAFLPRRRQFAWDARWNRYTSANPGH